MRPLTVCLSVLPLLLLTGCAKRSSLQDRQAELCADLTQFNTAVATLRSLGTSDEMKDFRQALRQVKVTLLEVKQSARQLRAAEVAKLEEATSALDSAVEALPDRATLLQARERVARQVAAVEAAQAQLQSGLNCP